MSIIPEKPARKEEDNNFFFRWGDIAKFTIAEYLESCLSGSNKIFFTRFAPYSKFWKIRTDTEETEQYSVRKENPLERPINISRYFEGTLQKLPQIVIRHGGWTTQNSNLGGLSFGFQHTDGTQIAGITNESPVSIELTCASFDVDDLSRLVSFVELAFGPMGLFFHRGVLYPKKETDRRWVVYLPMSNVSVGSPSDQPISDDRKKRIWTQTISFDTRVEVSTWVQYGHPIKVYGPTNTIEHTSITLPDTIKVGQSYPILAVKKPEPSFYSVSDFRKAVILEGDILLGKRPGEVTVSLKSNSKNGELSIITSKTITIKP